MHALRTAGPLALALLAAGCSPWPPYGNPGRWPQPQGLGTLAMTGAPLRATTLDVVAKNERAYLLQSQAPGYGPDLAPVRESTTTLVEVDPATGAVAAVPAPPFAPAGLWPSDQARGFLALAGAQVAAYDGSAWSTLAPLPGTGALDLLYRADAERVFARRGTTVLLHAGGAWKDVTAALPVRPRQRVVLGPWSAGAVRLVWTEPGTTQLQACTQTVDTTTLAVLDAPVCKDALPVADFLGDALNGTPDDFQVLFRIDAGNALAWRFSGGAWSRGAILGATGVRQTPGARDACVDVGAVTSATSVRAVMRVEAGQPAQTLYLPSFALLGCSGDERTCARGVDLVVQTVNRDCTATAFLIDNLVDATRKVYLKRLALPARDPVTCSPACGAGQLCVASSETAGTCAIDPVGNATGSQLAASLVVQAQAFVGAVAPVLSFADPATGAALAGFTFTLDPSQRTIVSGPANTPVTMTVHAEGSVDRTMSFTTPNENTQADLGVVYLLRGTRLGRAPAGVASSALAAVLVEDAGASLVLPLLQADGGVAVTRVRADGAGALSTEALAPSDPTAGAPRVSPDGRWLLWRDAAGLEVQALATGQRAAVATALPGSWLLQYAVFSADGSTVAIPRVTPSGPVSVVALSASPQERFTATAAGDPQLQLSRDGALLLRHLNTGWELAAASGAAVVSTAAGALLSGDGSRLYTTQGSVGALTLSVQATSAGAAPTPVATGVRVVTVDPAGADAQFASGPTAGGTSTVSRVAGATGAVSVVQSGVAGSGEALGSLGALWVRGTGGTTVFFPFGAAGRALAGNHTFAADDRGQLLAVATGLLVGESSVTSLPPGPGVFTADATRRVVPASASISTLSGTTEVSVRRYASPALTPVPVVDARFTAPATDGRQSYLAPCALYSVPVKRPTIAPSGGAVTWQDDGAEVYCVR